MLLTSYFIVQASMISHIVRRTQITQGQSAWFTEILVYEQRKYPSTDKFK